MSKEMCYHPELRPTQWNQPRPEPAEMVGCPCRMNISCPVCGFGRGASPCGCSPKLKEFIDELEGKEENETQNGPGQD